jgi:hypothetical protein
MIILSENTSLFLEKHITENHKVFSFVGNRMHSLLQKHGLLGTSSPFIHYHRQWGYIIVETTAYDVYVSDTEVIPRRLAFLDDFLRTRDLAYNRVIFNDTSTRVVRMVVDDITLRVVYMDINGPQPTTSLTPTTTATREKVNVVVYSSSNLGKHKWESCPVAVATQVFLHEVISKISSTCDKIVLSKFSL